MDLATQASLIVATFELSAVRLVRGAMLAADIASGRGQPASGLGPAPNLRYLPSRHIEPEPVYEPRQHIEPSPRYEARTIHYTVQLEPRLEHQDNTLPQRGLPPVEGAAAVSHFPFPPIWKSLPPAEDPPPARRPIKVIRHYPDIHHRGIIVDVHA